MHEKIDFNDKWMLAEDIPDIDLFFSEIWMKAFTNNMENSVGRNYSKVLGIFNEYDLKFYYGEKDALEFTKHILQKIIDKPEFGNKINSKIIKKSDELVEFTTKEIFETDLKQKSNKELWELYEKHLDLHTKMYEYCWLPNATDMFYPEYTNYLKKYLKTKTSDEEKLSKYFVVLTNPSKESVENIQTKKKLKIAIQLEKDCETKKLFREDLQTIKEKLKPEFLKLIEEHWNNYKFLQRLWIGQPSTLEYYLKQFKDILLSPTHLENDLKKIDEELKQKQEEKEKLLEELNIEEHYKKMFEIFGEFMITKIYRRYKQLEALFHIEKLQKEIAKRVNLSLKQLRFILPEEMKELLLEGKIDLEEINKRTKFCVYYTTKGQEFILTNEKAQKIAEKVQTIKIDKDLKELHGQVACPGLVKGKVKIIIRDFDMYKMKKGDILVSIATDPDIVPAMKKASAIVTEQGGVTSHAAIVSRELGIPCIIGTKIATKILKDNDSVEVNATKGIVKILEN